MSGKYSCPYAFWVSQISAYQMSVKIHWPLFTIFSGNDRIIDVPSNICDSMFLHYIFIYWSFPFRLVQVFTSFSLKQTLCCTRIRLRKFLKIWKYEFFFSGFVQIPREEILVFPYFFHRYEVNCRDDWAAFECFFDEICDIVDRVNVLRHNLYWALVSWIQNYEALKSLSSV